MDAAMEECADVNDCMELFGLAKEYETILASYSGKAADASIS
jgi:hypothetical protein